MFIYMKGDKYIGMDSASGGYPYETDGMFSAKTWNTIEAARTYEKHFNEGWDLFEVKGLNLSKVG